MTIFGRLGLSSAVLGLMMMMMMTTTKTMMMMTMMMHQRTRMAASIDQCWASVLNNAAEGIGNSGQAGASSPAPTALLLQWLIGTVEASMISAELDAPNLPWIYPPSLIVCILLSMLTGALPAATRHGIPHPLGLTRCRLLVHWLLLPLLLLLRLL